MFDYKDYISDREKTFRSHREPFDVEEMVTDTVSMFEGVSKLKNINITVEIDPAVPHIVLADRQRIMQVLRNYIENAVKFSVLIP
jgi:signal transduction histidine kinase